MFCTRICVTRTPIGTLLIDTQLEVESCLGEVGILSKSKKAKTKRRDEKKKKG